MAAPVLRCLLESELMASDLAPQMTIRYPPASGSADG